MSPISDELDLAAFAAALGATSLGQELTEQEQRILARSSHRRIGGQEVQRYRAEILRGTDLLGDAFASIRSPEERRVQGATYTPQAIVGTMVEWADWFRRAAGGGGPTRIIDPGAGSGRFLIAAGKAFPKAQLVGVELDPLASVCLRANLAANRMLQRSQVLNGDFRQVSIPKVAGRTLFIGNPPYVRHHQIGAQWKQWLTSESEKLGLSASQLAGLHVHFFLSTLLHASPGDYGAFITSAEWLDVNYGRLVRELFVNHLGGTSLTIVEPTARPFPDAASTAVISTFEVASKSRSIRVRRVDDVVSLSPLQSGRRLLRTRFDPRSRWSHLTRRSHQVPSGYVELGELCRVHRGQVTGANHVWIAGTHSNGLPPAVLFRTVTKARELFAAEGVLHDAGKLRDVIDIPRDLDTLDADDRDQVERFLSCARKMGAADGYVASNRKAWWAVELRDPAPILATYMARRPPAFVLNPAQARHINVAHGLYPREPLSTEVLTGLAHYLSSAIKTSEGRTYSGGLTKFEPREMERLLVPSPDALMEGVA